MQEISAKAPFFIIGHPRSGTTLLQILLDAHPNIVIPPESHIFVRFAEIFDSYGDLSEVSNLELFVQDILNDERIKLWGLNISVVDFCRQLKTFSIKGVLSLLFELYAQREGKTRWGDKTPQHALYLQEIKRVFPEGKFIHLVRDGRDVAESLKRVIIGKKSISGIAHRWKKYILFFQEFKLTLQPDDFIEVYYEDLVQNTEYELSKILEFLGENPQDLVKFIPDTGRKQEYLKSKTVHSSLNEAISSKKVGIFQKKMRKRDIEIFESIAFDALKIHIYPLTTSGKTKVKFHEKIRDLIEDNLLRYLIKFIKLDRINLVKKQIKFGFQFQMRKLLRSRRNPHKIN